MSKLDITERLTFLAEKCDIFDTGKVNTTDEANYQKLRKLLPSVEF